MSALAALPPLADDGASRPPPRLPEAAASAAAEAAGIDHQVLAGAVELALAGGPAGVGPDAGGAAWRQLAHCRGGKADRFYPGRGAKGLGAVVEACRSSCPVQRECLAAALLGGELYGVWGGTTAAGRRRLRRVLRQAGVLGVVGEEALP